MMRIETAKRYLIQDVTRVTAMMRIETAKRYLIQDANIEEDKR